MTSSLNYIQSNGLVPGDIQIIRNWAELSTGAEVVLCEITWSLRVLIPAAAQKVFPYCWKTVSFYIPWVCNVFPYLHLRNCIKFLSSYHLTLFSITDITEDYLLIQFPHILRVKMKSKAVMNHILYKGGKNLRCLSVILLVTLLLFRITFDIPSTIDI